MSKLKTNPPEVFLSSLFTELEEERKELQQIGLSAGVELFVAELDAPNLGDLAPDQLFDNLVSHVKRSDAVVCLLGPGRAGSKMNLFDRITRVSFLEAEIYQALVRSKRLKLLTVPGFSPDPELRELLTILKPLLREAELVICDTVHHLFDECRKVFEAVRDEHHRKANRPLLSQFHVALDLQRTGTKYSQLFERRVEFLPYAQETTTLGDLDHVEDLLKAALDEPHKERRLGRLWIAYRQLGLASAQGTRERRALEQYNRILSEWGAAAAWYGLHGHLHLSPLAAYHSCELARQALRRRSSKSPNPLTVSPHGALASAHYSLAAKQAHPLWRRRSLRRGLSLALAGLADSPDEKAKSGLLSSCGNLSLRLFRPRDAEKYFNKAHHLREKHGQSQYQIGQGLIEIGQSLCFQAKVREGIRIAEEGLALQRTGPLGDQFVRGLRQVAAMHFFSAKPKKSLEYLDEARTLAIARGLDDQLEQIDRESARARRLSGWGSRKQPP